MKHLLPNASAELPVQEAAEWIRSAEALLIGAGAGMGVDSGLPDFRGTEGFWNAYPPFRHLGLEFTDLANPAWFHKDPALAWGFYGHRLNLYRRTQPHAGFEILQKWAAAKSAGAFVYTSNVDGHFQKSGFNEARVLECHGSIHRLQCVDESAGRIWEAGETQVLVDETRMRAMGGLPRDPLSDKLARPNILMFNDFEWNCTMTDAQQGRYRKWLAEIAGKRLVVVELGAGTAIPSVRFNSDRLVANFHAQLIRINLREPEVENGQIGMACGALAGLMAIDSMLNSK